jgi:hypothetical protein
MLLQSPQEVYNYYYTKSQEFWYKRQFNTGAKGLHKMPYGCLYDEVLKNYKSDTVL